MGFLVVVNQLESTNNDINGRKFEISIGQRVYFAHNTNRFFPLKFIDLSSLTFESFQLHRNALRIWTISFRSFGHQSPVPFNIIIKPFFSNCSIFSMLAVYLLLNIVNCRKHEYDSSNDWNANKILRNIRICALKWNHKSLFSLWSAFWLKSNSNYNNLLVTEPPIKRTSKWLIIFQNSYASHHSPASSSRFLKCSSIDMSSHLISLLLPSFSLKSKLYCIELLYGIPKTHFESLYLSLSCTSELEGYNKTKILHEKKLLTQDKRRQKTIFYNEFKNKWIGRHLSNRH